MKLLCVDIGNTRLKATLTGDGAPREVCNVLREPGEGVDAGQLREAVADMLAHTADQAMVCGVGENPESFASLLRSEGMRVATLTHATPLPIDIEYHTPETLGPDRVACACGAADIARERPGAPIIVADAGTALTLDCVMERAGKVAFMGGNICAGLRLRLQSLHGYTSRLPLVDIDKVSEFAKYPCGYDTESAIATGALLGLRHEIAGFAATMSQAYGVPATVVLTGGDISKLYPDGYDKAGVFKTIRSPHLLALGLRAISLYNSDLPFHNSQL